jgi:DNA polymerase
MTDNAMTSVTITETLEEVRRTLSDLAHRGVKGVDLPSETMATLGRWGTSAGSTESHAPRPEGGAVNETLEQIREDLGECQRCPLGKTRNHLVFGAGNPGARLAFVGEAPGYDEDLQGEPFVGAAGKLLTRIIEAMGLTRNDVYICNILKCRPPGNRNPLPEETEVCTPFLNRQLAAISPECICALGKFAAQHLHGSQTPISRLRGRFFDYNGIQVMPTYHPAYLLRNPEGKRDVWNDIQQIMKVLGIKAPRK